MKKRKNQEENTMRKERRNKNKEFDTAIILKNKIKGKRMVIKKN